MDKDLKILYQYVMGPLMKLEAKEFGCFFSQEEYENNIGKISIIKNSFNKLQEKLEEWQKK